MADAGGTTVAKKNTPQLDKAEVLDLVNDSLGFLDRIFTEQGLGVLEANADTNGVRDFLGEQWDTSRIGKWLQYTDGLAQHLGAEVRRARVLAYHAGQADQNRHLTHVGDYKVVINLDQGVIDLVEQTMRDVTADDLIVRSLIRLDGGKSEVIITPVSGIDQEDLDRLVRPVVQVVKDNHWEDDGLGDEGDDNDNDGDDEPGHTDKEITDRLTLIMDTFLHWVDEHGFDPDLWLSWVNRISEEVFNGVPVVEFADEDQKRQWGLHKIMYLADCLNRMIIDGGRVTTGLRGQLDGARKRAKAAKKKSAILEAQLKECNAARSQQGQRAGQTTQQTSKESELADQVRDLRRELDAEKKKHAETKQKYKAASARAGDGNGDASGEEGDENDEQSRQEKLEAVCARLDQVRKQSKQVVELQDKTRKRAKEAEEARKNLESSLVKEIQKNAKLEKQLKASGKTTTTNGSPTADAAALAADLAQANKDKDDLEKKAKDAEKRLGEAQKKEQDQAAAHAKALDDARQAAKTKAAQQATALQKCQRDLAEAQKKKTAGDDSADDEESDDEAGVLSQAPLHSGNARILTKIPNHLSVTLKYDLVSADGTVTNKGITPEIGNSVGTGIAKVVKNQDGDHVLKIKARFEPKEGDKQRTEKQDNGEKPGDGGKNSKRRAGKDTEDAGQTGKKQKTGKAQRLGRTGR
ncbi:hypothetical protein IWX90DRAFT_506726 [Phyllosticta citrichinensis]|uniref:Uncharacterized protein n=1 Tax=Phyllosticta citrichinensis TaxID=1130410 RepID=A0ABR1XNS0_9PEZI